MEAPQTQDQRTAGINRGRDLTLGRVARLLRVLHLRATARCQSEKRSEAWQHGGGRWNGLTMAAAVGMRAGKERREGRLRTDTPQQGSTEAAAVAAAA
jgi:hypothetical protein